MHFMELALLTSCRRVTLDDKAVTIKPLPDHPGLFQVRWRESLGRTHWLRAARPLRNTRQLVRLRGYLQFSKVKNIHE